MAYEDVLVHTATPVREAEGAPYIEGEPDVDAEVFGEPFACCLFLPNAPEDQTAPRGRRVVKRPQLLLAPEADPSPADRLDIVAPELTGPDPVRWQVETDPQPFGPPGEPIIGKLANVKRVED